MLFKRRDPPSLSERVRVAIWPRRSWSRSTRYMVNRVGRLRDSTFAIAFGFACGVFVSFTPFVGFHFLLGGLLAFVGRGSIIASAFGTFFGNPLTLPLIWISSYKLGSWLLGGEGHFSAAVLRQGFEELWPAILNGSWDVSKSAIEMLWPLIKPMTVGSVPLGLLTATICYYAVARLVEAYKQRRGPRDAHHQAESSAPHHV
ncbi:MAG: DUF2062 domain-containing protein [Hyphomicrobiaceae bacterium]